MEQAMSLKNLELQKLVHKYELIPIDKIEVIKSFNIGNIEYHEDVDELFDLFVETMALREPVVTIDVNQFLSEGAIEAANLDQLYAFMAYVINDERFVDNLFGSLVSDGTIGRIVDRLKSLLDFES